MNCNSENYVNEALRTDCIYDEAMKERLINSIELLHGAMGMVTEAGELIDMLKKHIFYAKPLDLVNAIEEVGDNFWYNAKTIDAINKLNGFVQTINDVMTQNNAKLRLRYPAKFTEDCAINRDVESERVLLESYANSPVEITKAINEKLIEENKKFEKELIEGTSDIKNPIGLINCKELSGKNYYIKISPNLSIRAIEFAKFTSKVIEHIEKYTVPQYGDKGQDQITEWTVEECLKAVSKRIARFGRQSREGQQELDFLKMAHEVQIAATKYAESKGVK